MRQNATLARVTTTANTVDEDQMDGLSDPPPKQEYTLTGVLDFLQKSWVQFELERARWGVERSELLSRISQLEGERKGQENLKHDLVRRIKMLEYALKQERLRYSQQLDPNGKASENSVPPQPPPVTLPSSRLVRSAARRETLKKYLQELGSADILLVKTPPAFVMPAVLTSGLSKLANQLNTPIPGLSTQPTQPTQPTPTQPTQTTPAQTTQLVQPTFPPNHENHVSPQQTTPVSLHSFAESLNSNAAPAASLSDFTAKDSVDANALASSLASFAPAPQSETSNAPQQNTTPSSPTPTTTQPTSKTTPNKLDEPTEEELASISGANFKKMMGRMKVKGGSNLADLRNMIKNNSAGKGDIKIVDLEQPASGNSIAPGSPMPITTEEKTRQRNTPAVPPPKKEAAAPELPDFTLDDETSSNNNSNTTVSGARSWKFKYTLRSHFDSVRSLVFHPTESVLLSASEDGTWKMWNLQSLAPSIHKPPVTELEPVYTFRGHTGPVYALALAADKGRVLTAGGDSLVRVWTLPPASLDPYDRHGIGVDYHLRKLEGHTDAIWSLALHPHLPQVLSASADDSIRLWDYERPDPLLHTLTLTDASGLVHTPTSVDMVQTNLAQCVASYTSSSLAVFDLETGQPALTLFQNGDPTTQINKVITHPTLPLAITAHDDKKISFVDIVSGKNVHTMVGHLDSVSALAIDPSVLYLLSAGHDSSLRFWDINTRVCVQEMNAHRPKFNESIHAVAYHPSKTFVASGGADSTVRIYM